MPDRAVFIGTSGFYYEHWKGVFYPADLSKTKFFDYYIKKFDTLEINSTFYHMPKSKTIEHWIEKSPDNFVFSLKANRSITHYKKLKNCKNDLYAFLHLIKPMKAKLGAVLFQLPPSLKIDIDLLAAFLHILPVGYRFAFEFRNATWFEEEVYELLRRYNAAFCIYDFNKRESPKEITAEFVYIRLHGPDGPYRGCYSEESLLEWAGFIKNATNKGKKIFCYFDNDYEGNAPKNAKRLIELLNKDSNL
ncbi:DUF72 domain-containing protein [Nitrosophilus alvini]|uniref:DUF72 domain-containing protein n=1 Tax=Nitrosophilus alvini TaxID=2714855 RepID=UPI001909119B|nr:DUF72 domain-containing protein [Nitrosophilus alvini]